MKNGKREWGEVGAFRPVLENRWRDRLDDPAKIKKKKKKKKKKSDGACAKIRNRGQQNALGHISLG